jgi:hypothetical protein
MLRCRKGIAVSTDRIQTKTSKSLLGHTTQIKLPHCSHKSNARRAYDLEMLSRSDPILIIEKPSKMIISSYAMNYSTSIVNFRIRASQEALAVTASIRPVIRVSALRHASRSRHCPPRFLADAEDKKLAALKACSQRLYRARRIRCNPGSSKRMTTIDHNLCPTFHLPTARLPPSRLQVIDNTTVSRRSFAEPR